MFAEYVKQLDTPTKVSPEEIERQQNILNRIQMVKNFPSSIAWSLLSGRKKLGYALAYAWYEKKTFEIMPGMVLNFQTNTIEYK